MSKAKAQRKHARVRARERYGLEVGTASRKEIIGAIQGGRSFVMRKVSLRTTIHDVDLSDGLRVRVVYDRNRKELVTFLTPPQADAS